MSGSKKITVGYKHLLGMHMVLCHGPVDSVDRIDVADRTAWTGTNTGGQIVVDKPELFGGDSREGGVSGTIDIAMGEKTQAPNTYLQARLGNDIPAFRGVTAAILRQCYLGNNPYLKPIAFWATRIHTRSNGNAQWHDAQAEVSGDMNPAHILRELLTDTSWGMGYADADLDEASFQDAADTLAAEDFGLSILWEKTQTIEDMVQVVLQHIDGVLYVDRTDGKFRVKLARDDYVVGDLPILGEADIVSVTEFRRPALGDLVNQVTVKYWDYSSGQDQSVTVQDIALAAQQQGTVGTVVEYPGVVRGDLAVRLASRDLRAMSTPLASVTLECGRAAALLTVGDVFRLQWPRLGLADVVMRVSSLELGDLAGNTVKLQAVEDVFALGDSAYAPPPPSGWVSPRNAPAPCPEHVVIEAPYYELAQRIGDSQAQALDASACYLVATGTRPSSDALNAAIVSDPANVGDWQESGVTDFCPAAELAGNVGFAATSLTITDGQDLDAVPVGSYAIMGSEIIRIDVVTGSTLTVGRGCLDTVPVAHTAGERIYFADAFFDSDNIEYATAETARVRLLPVTALGQLAVGSATTQAVTMAARQARPLPPGRLRINTLSYPASISASADLVIAWAHRDRLQQTGGEIADTEDASIGPETGTTYTVRVLQADGTPIHTVASISGTTTTIAAGTINPHTSIRVELSAQRDGLDSWQAHDVPVERV